jgi:hypothetical protein
MAATVVSSGTRRLSAGVLAVAAVLMAYFVGLIPAAATITVDHCYVKYDQLENQHSRCVGHWTRPGFEGSGLLQGVPVATNWPALTADPNVDLEWEVGVPDSAHEFTGLTLFAVAWILPGPVAFLTTVIAAVAVGFMAWTLLSWAGWTYRRR